MSAGTPVYVDVLPWPTGDALLAEVAAEVDRIEAGYVDRDRLAALTVEEAWWGVNSALDDAKTTRGKSEQHRYLVRLAAWATVALRAEAREQTSAKGAGHG